MKILFICGSLVLGKDGVGDYSRRLAGELIRQGHQSRIVSLYDKDIDAISKEEQETEGTKIEVLRLPKSMKTKLKFIKAREYIDQFSPDWLSLQYVPYSFHDKGLPIRLVGQLKKIGKGKKWHIMFHELWIGMREPAVFKDIAIGAIQKLIVKRLIFQLNSSVNHTQSPFYQKLLSKHSMKVDVLPLFSNFSENQLVESSMSTRSLKDLNEISLIVFATIHACDRDEEFFKMLLSYQQRTNKEIVLKAIGRNGSEINTWKKICKRLGLSLKIYGEQDASFILNILKESTIGITTSALPMVEKSAAVATMRVCSLPVICLADTWESREIDYDYVPKGIFKFEENVIDSCLNFDDKSVHKNSLKNIASKLLVDLT